MNGSSLSNPRASRIRTVLLLFTITSFLLMTAGSIYVNIYQEDPGKGEFLINTAGPVFWFFGGLWLLFNVITLLNSRR
ncbi:MAG TPA: hypothetical protein HA306_09800 [Methanosarcina sp.]|nr:hypothetical protein [Methanosarcina sp.]